MNIQDIRDGFQLYQAIGLNSALSDQQLGQILGAPRTHKEQPLLHVVRAAIDPTQNAAATAWTTDYAIRNIQARGDDALKTWLDAAMSRACDIAAFENASGALGEVRAAGTLTMAGAKVSPIPEDPKKKTPDFKVEVAGRDIFVEINTKNMVQEEAEKLHRFNQGPPGEHVVRPAGGKPDDPKDTTVENVASKFAAIKSKGLQAVPGEPGVLWLDLQDEDWWTLSARDVEVAWVGNDGAFFTSGLWHAFYGVKGTKMLEGHSVQRQAATADIEMRFDGMFKQHARWSGAILSFRRDLVLFQNPEAEVALPREFIELATRMYRFDYLRSWVDWPPGRAPLAGRVAAARGHVDCLASVAQYTW